MKSLDIKESIDVNVNASRAWEIIGPNFLNIADWGRGILKSWKNESAPQKFENAPAGGRYCELVGFGKFDERIIHFDSGNYEITWSAAGVKLPKFVSGLQNNLKVAVVDEHKCTVTSNITANLSGMPGLLLGSLLKKNFTKQIHGFLQDWKIYAETGEVSESKKREIAKFAAQEKK
ncbi:MAG: hypothetical protein OEV24_16570 [Cyclobacteriaceae bacterium]|nr:hypothetical protein [Cyclobacteriaceae bacterium]MDH5249475.1 hypothetical protein [Cyclobacteriaceae bacterium]